MNLFMSADHGGFELKTKIIDFLKFCSQSKTSNELKQKHPQIIDLSENDFSRLKTLSVQDLGCYDTQSVNYSDYAEKVCVALLTKNFPSSPISEMNSTPSNLATKDALSFNSMGVLICGSGQGMAMKANKYPHIRAALVWSEEITALSREHNNSNILCLPGRFLNESVAINCLLLFLTTAFAGGRHSARVEKINNC